MAAAAFSSWKPFLIQRLGRSTQEPEKIQIPAPGAKRLLMEGKGKGSSSGCLEAGQGVGGGHLEGSEGLSPSFEG